MFNFPKFLLYNSISTFNQEYFTKVPKSSLAWHSHRHSNQEGNVNHSEVPLHSSQEFDLGSFEFDLGGKTSILNYHSNHRNIIKRTFLLYGPC